MLVSMTGQVFDTREDSTTHRSLFHHCCPHNRPSGHTQRKVEYRSHLHTDTDEWGSEDLLVKHRICLNLGSAILGKKILCYDRLYMRDYIWPRWWHMMQGSVSLQNLLFSGFLSTPDGIQHTHTHTHIFTTSHSWTHTQWAKQANNRFIHTITIGLDRHLQLPALYICQLN